MSIHHVPDPNIYDERRTICVMHADVTESWPVHALAKCAADLISYSGPVARVTVIAKVGYTVDTIIVLLFSIPRTPNNYRIGYLDVHRIDQFNELHGKIVTRYHFGIQVPT